MVQPICDRHRRRIAARLARSSFSASSPEEETESNDEFSIPKANEEALSSNETAPKNETYSHVGCSYPLA